MSPNLIMLSLIAIMHQMNAQSIDCKGNCECPSTSSEDTCTLNCHGTDRCKDGKLQCRSGDKCIIDCDGGNSCSGNTVIDASGATDVIVSCIGIDACKGNTIINCGTKSCAVTCDSSSSCEDTTVEAPFATSLQCTGSCNSFKSFPTITVTVTTSAPSETDAIFISTQYSTNIPVHTTTLIQRLNPTTSPTLNPSVSPTFNPTKTQTIATTEPAISTIVVYTTKQQTEIPPSVHTTKEAEISTTDVDVYTTTQQTDDSINTTSEPTISTTEIYQKIVYNMASNPMWYFVIASAALIIIGSIFCCFGLFFYYKARTKHVAVAQCKDPPEANIGVKAKEAGTETTYKDADSDVNVDGYGFTTPSGPENIFVDDIKKITVSTVANDGDIDNINNDVSTTNEYFKIDIHESDSTGELSSNTNINITLETKDGGYEDTMHEAYMCAEAVCGVNILPPVAQCPMNMMMTYPHQRSIPLVNMASHLPPIPT